MNAVGLTQLVRRVELGHQRRVAPAALPAPLQLLQRVLVPRPGLLNLPGRQVQSFHVLDARVDPLPEVPSAAAAQIEEPRAGPREPLDEELLDVVVEPFQGEGGALFAALVGLLLR